MACKNNLGSLLPCILTMLGQPDIQSLVKESRVSCIQLIKFAKCFGQDKIFPDVLHDFCFSKWSFYDSTCVIREKCIWVNPSGWEIWTFRVIFCQFSCWPGVQMSNHRAEKKFPVDKYTKDSNGIALFLLQFGSI